MTGDRHKPESLFSRWVEAFDDGFRSVTRKGKTKIPSSAKSKRYERRWRRRQNASIAQ